MLWFLGALALLGTWLVIMPKYFAPTISQGRQLTVKAIPTVMAALFALCACLRGADPYALLVCIALFICAAADVLLGIRFVIGGALFLSGHLLYMAALSRCQTPGRSTIWVFLVAVAALWLFCRRYFHLFESKLLFAGVLVYCMALGMLLGLSLPLPFQAFSRRTVLAAMGALLFVFSDMGTCHVMLTPAGKTFNFCSLAVYYTAQLLLGMSAF